MLSFDEFLDFIGCYKNTLDNDEGNLKKLFANFDNEESGKIGFDDFKRLI